jgi:hypothetical protein
MEPITDALSPLRHLLRALAPVYLVDALQCAVLAGTPKHIIWGDSETKVLE